jgi:hypothetical protein
MTHLVTFIKPVYRHFLPPNCTFSHCIREPLLSPEFDTNYFNEINNLEDEMKASERLKVV